MGFEGMLLDPSLDMICIFLLMSMYMLGACRRNGAFMYLGVAARSAHALGLHVPESYLHLEPDEHSLRSVRSTGQSMIGTNTRTGLKSGRAFGS